MSVSVHACALVAAQRAWVKASGQAALSNASSGTGREEKNSEDEQGRGGIGGDGARERPRHPDNLSSGKEGEKEKEVVRRGGGVVAHTEWCVHVCVLPCVLVPFAVCVCVSV